MQDNPSVLVALKHGKLPYTDETGALLLMKTLVSNLMTIFFFLLYTVHIHVITLNGSFILKFDFACLCQFITW